MTLLVLNNRAQNYISTCGFVAWRCIDHCLYFQGTYKEFKTGINQMFPIIYDTKHVAQSLFKVSSKLNSLIVVY